MKSRPGTITVDKIRMLVWPGIVVTCVAIGIGLLCFRNLGDPASTENAVSVVAQSNEPIQPIEPLSGLDPRKIELGRKLFHDPHLSHNDQLSCAHCHDLKTGGTDRKARSTGINGAVGVINAPTVLNSGYNFSQFWDGRAATLESQIDGPLQSNIEMGSTWPEVIEKLKRSKDYVQSFSKSMVMKFKATTSAMLLLSLSAPYPRLTLVSIDFSATMTQL
jgi:cytochrome c peroxidase